jgi:tetratricopeptide (TPR) repeat protein
MTTRRTRREARARLILGIVLSDVCGEEYAAELYRQALNYDPEFMAAHVRLGISHAYAEDYAAMLGSFAEALRMDSGAARAVFSDDVDEAKQIKTILFPPEPSEDTGGYVSAMPAEFKEAGELIASATGHLAAGRDEEAVRALERSLRIDETNQYAVALLTLTYMLLRRSPTAARPVGNASILFEVDAALAKMLFI